MPSVDAFERRARAARRAVRRLPLLRPVADRLGMLAWRFHLARTARHAGLVLPTAVTLDPRRVTPTAASRLTAEGRRVAVELDRHGRTRVVAGGDLLAAARDAGETAVEAGVARRHPRWQRLALEVRAYAHLRGGTAYQPYIHPDLADLPSDQGCHERFEVLRAALPADGGTLVDLGANSGWFSHRFEAAGFDCVAVERSRKELHFLTALRRAAGARFTILAGSLTEVRLPARPDVVLALNIFHHFLKTEAGYRELAAFLGRLDARLLLFQTHLPGEAQMASAHWNPEPGEFAERVRELAGFADVRELARAADGRPIYLLGGAA